MARVPSIGRQVELILKEKNGIGESKRESRNHANTHSLETNHKISPKIHSYKSLENIRNELSNLGKFVKREFGIKELQQITITHVRQWLQQKSIGYRTASNYLSNLNKVHASLSFSPEEIKTLRESLSETLERPNPKPRTYDLTHVQIHPRSEIPYLLQKQYGLRLTAATRINLDRQLHQNTLSFQQKGGKWSEIELTSSLASKIREKGIEGKFELNGRMYSRDLKKAIEGTGQKYNGTHGMRHTYAQEKLVAHSKQEVSEMLGHEREEIILVYLR